MRVLIVKAGSTIASLVPRRGDFEDWFRAGLEMDGEEAPLVAPGRGEALPDPDGVPAALVTGSASMATDAEPWSVATERWLAGLVRLGRPVLGVCYGHHLLARAFGGRVGWTPGGREIGTVRVALTDEGRRAPLFAELPDELVVQATHQQSVLALPPGARHLAANAQDPFQAFSLGERAFAVQFHPEFDADVVRGYVSARRADLAREGTDPDQLLAEACDSDHGACILRAFRDQFLS